jgi:hypothetical protein
VSEGGRRELRVRPWKQHLAGELDPEPTAPAWQQPQRLPSRGQRPTSHVDQILGFGAGQLTHPVLRCTHRDLDQDLRDVDRDQTLGRVLTPALISTSGDRSGRGNHVAGDPPLGDVAAQMLELVVSVLAAQLAQSKANGSTELRWSGHRHPSGIDRSWVAPAAAHLRMPGTAVRLALTRWSQARASATTFPRCSAAPSGSNGTFIRYSIHQHPGARTGGSRCPIRCGPSEQRSPR